jgi:hypothetical protein
MVNGMRVIFLLGLILTCINQYIKAQESGHGYTHLSTLEEGMQLNDWKFNEGDNPNWAQKDFDDSNWQIIQINNPLNKSRFHYSNRFWLRTTIGPEYLKGDSLFALHVTQFGAFDLYVNGRLIKSLGKEASINGLESNDPHNFPIPVILEKDDINVIAIRFTADLPLSDWVRSRSNVPLITVKLQHLDSSLSNWAQIVKNSRFSLGLGFASGALSLLFLMLYLFFPQQLLYLFYGLFNLFLVLMTIVEAYLDTGQYDLTERAYLISGTFLLSRLIGMNILLFILYALNRMKPIFWMYVGFMILIDFPLTILLPVEYLFISSVFRSLILVISA